MSTLERYDIRMPKRVLRRGSYSGPMLDLDGQRPATALAALRARSTSLLDNLTGIPMPESRK